MSKYTTEVRFICEQKAGLLASVGADDVDSIIANSWNKIFTTKAPLFDESYRQTLFSKILKHYYTQEIAYETVGLWLLKMNTKMEEILPYYNKIYTAVQKDYNILYDVDYTETGNKTGNGNEKYETGGSRDQMRTDNLQHKRTDDLNEKRTDNLTEKTSNDTDSTTTTDLLDKTTNNLTQVQSNNLTTTDTGSGSNTHNDNYQETPQGSLTMVAEMNYLTNARRVTDDGTNTNTRTDTGDVTTDNTGTQEIEKSGTVGVKSTQDMEKNNTGTQTRENTGNQTTDYTGTQQHVESYGDLKTGEISNTEDYVNHVVGKRGSMTYAAMVEDYIARLKNVDMLVVDEFRKEFMQIW